MRVEAAPPKINLEYLYSKCCKVTPGNRMVEAVYQRFPDERIIIWCHEEGRLVPLPSYVETKFGEDFAGPLVVTGSADGEEGAYEVPLTVEQVAMVQKHLRVFKEPVLRPLY